LLRTMIWAVHDPHLYIKIFSQIFKKCNIFSKQVSIDVLSVFKLLMCPA
jgi:hypothetical protein